MKGIFDEGSEILMKYMRSHMGVKEAFGCKTSEFDMGTGTTSGICARSTGAGPNVILVFGDYEVNVR